MRLAVMHNLYFYNQLTQRIRDSLDQDCFEEFRGAYSKKIGRTCVKPLAKEDEVRYNSAIM